MANTTSTQRLHSTPTDRDQARRELLANVPVTERRLELGGVSTAVLEAGDGDGRPVVLLHGPGGWAGHWMRIVPDLARTHRIVAPDLPGQGGSVVRDGTLDRGRVTAWLGALIEATCTTPPVLVGQTVGGAIAATFASSEPARVRALVLVDTLGLQQFDPAPEFGRALEAYLTGPDAASHDELWRYCAFDLPGLQHQLGSAWAAFTDYDVDRARDPGVQAALHELMNGFGFPAIDDDVLAGIAVPTTLVWGRHDLATPLSVAQDVSDRHGWPLHVIDGAADDPAIEQPEAFMQTLRDVLGATSTGPGPS